MPLLTFSVALSLLLLLSVSNYAIMATPVAAERALNFFSIVGKLKTLKRTGWVDNEISLPESVADHMYRMSMLNFALVDPTLDKDRLIKICLCHDLAEAIAGDITPTERSGVSKEEKRKLEKNALNEIIADLDHAALGEEIRVLWLEYVHTNRVPHVL